MQKEDQKLLPQGGQGLVEETIAKLLEAEGQISGLPV